MLLCSARDTYCVNSCGVAEPLSLFVVLYKDRWALACDITSVHTIVFDCRPGAHAPRDGRAVSDTCPSPFEGRMYFE